MRAYRQDPCRASMSPSRISRRLKPQPEGMPFAEGRVEGATGSTAETCGRCGAANDEHRKPRNIFELIFGRKSG